MKRKYCLVRETGNLDVGSFVYVVWVGSSLRESTLLALVEEFAKDCGWYFKRWSANVDSALELRTKQLRVDGTRIAPPYQMISINIRECYERIIDDSWSDLESNHVMTHQETFLRFRHDPAYLRQFNRKNGNTSCPPSERKYLSPRMQSDMSRFVLGMVGIVMLILLDTFVSNYIL